MADKIQTIAAVVMRRGLSVRLSVLVGTRMLQLHMRCGSAGMVMRMDAHAVAGMSCHSEHARQHQGNGKEHA